MTQLTVGNGSIQQQILRSAQMPNLVSPAGHNNFFPTVVKTAATAVGSALLKNALSGVTSTATKAIGETFPTGSRISIEETVGGRRRRRRRALLTQSDKADIAFLIGQLGTGQLGRSAITALLSRRC